MINYGTGGRTGHAAVILKDEDETYVLESTNEYLGQKGMITISKWISGPAEKWLIGLLRL